MNNTWAIVLAAGSSTRMKRQKLLLPYNGKTMVEEVIMNAKQVVNENILVVLGSDHYEIRNQISILPISICLNRDYKKGMLSSVICGFKAVPEDAKAVLVFLGDQPQIPSSVAELVIKAWKDSESSIIIPVFEGRRGHPVLIETKYKPEIERLDPDKGLRQLMLDFPGEILEVECSQPEILRDIDTPGDYNKEISNNIK
jgi:molybdenum cofactor cytidylyltransferase